MIIDWNQFASNFSDTISNVIDWFGGYASTTHESSADIHGEGNVSVSVLVVHATISLQFRIGETVYLKNDSFNAHTIVGYLADNEHYILENGCIVSASRLTRTPSHNDLYAQIAAIEQIIANTEAIVDPENDCSSCTTSVSKTLNKRSYCELDKKIAAANRTISNIRNYR